MKYVFLCLLSLYTSQTLAQQFIEWNYDKTARASGSECKGENVDFITAGNEISVIFAQMGLSLQPGSPKNEVRVSCSVNIPAKIKSGKFVRELNEQFVYGYVREEGTQGEISVRSKFERENSGKIETVIPTPGQDPFMAPYVAKQVLTKWQMKPSWCTGREFKTKLVTDIVIRAHRKNKNASIVITTDGFDARYDAEVKEGTCK